MKFFQNYLKSTVTSKIKNKWPADERLKIFLQFGFNTDSGATTKVKLWILKKWTYQVESLMLCIEFLLNW